MKAKQIIAYLKAYPDATPMRVAAKFSVTRATVYRIRRKMRMPVETVVESTPEPETVVESTPEPVASSRQVGGDHYKSMKVEPWSVVDSWSHEQRIGYYRGNALKYLMRMGRKDNAPEDAAKAQHYMEKLLETIQEG